MSISYPLVLPASPPSFASVEMIGESLVGLAASPFTGQQQVYEWPGQFWRAKCSLPPMARVNSERWISFLLSLRGMAGTFLLGDPLGKAVQGTAGGAPIVNGAGQAGKQLAISGLTGVIKAGDYFHIGSAGENLLLQSQHQDVSPWTLNQLTAAISGSAAPDGTFTAIALTPTGGATDCFCWQNVIAPVGGQQVTFSLWISRVSSLFSLNIIIANQLSVNRATAVVNATAGWTRVSVTATMLPGDTGVQVFIGGGASWVVANGGLNVWGAQLERGGAPSNYIVTTTQQSGPTRQLLKNLMDAGPGSVTLDIFPKLRVPPVNADPLILANSVGVFRLASNSTPWTADKAKFYGISFEAVEAL